MRSFAGGSKRFRDADERRWRRPRLCRRDAGLALLRWRPRAAKMRSAAWMSMKAFGRAQSIQNRNRICGRLATEDLLNFVERRRISLDWLLSGNLKGLQDRARQSGLTSCISVF